MKSSITFLYLPMLVLATLNGCAHTQTAQPIPTENIKPISCKELTGRTALTVASSASNDFAITVMTNRDLCSDLKKGPATAFESGKEDYFWTQSQCSGLFTKTVVNTILKCDKTSGYLKVVGISWDAPKSRGVITP